MFNNVVIALCAALTEASMAALRFNFRGVGGSGGSHDKGLGEQEDVLAALEFLSGSQEVAGTALGLVGYSFGAAVSLPASLRDSRVEALALVSPPLTSAEWEAISGTSSPILIVGGTDDDFFSPPRRAPDTVEIELFPNVDHFWWGHEDKLGAQVSEFFGRAFHREG
jgi:alpha/beta superfamily hydrolase